MAEGWGSVKRETIVKKCGIISGESAVVARIGANEDPFDGVDEAHELTALVDELGVHDSTCSPQEYVTGDDNLLVCDDAGDDWDEHFLVGLSRNQTDTESQRIKKTTRMILSHLLQRSKHTKKLYLL